MLKLNSNTKCSIFLEWLKLNEHLRWMFNISLETKRHDLKWNIFLFTFNRSCTYHIAIKFFLHQWGWNSNWKRWTFVQFYLKIHLYYYIIRFVEFTKFFPNIYSLYSSFCFFSKECCFPQIIQYASVRYYEEYYLNNFLWRKPVCFCSNEILL